MSDAAPHDQRLKCIPFSLIPPGTEAERALEHARQARHPDGRRVIPPEWHARLGTGRGSFTQVVTDMIYATVLNPAPYRPEGL